MTRDGPRLNLLSVKIGGKQRPRKRSKSSIKRRLRNRARERACDDVYRLLINNGFKINFKQGSIISL